MLENTPPPPTHPLTKDSKLHQARRKGSNVRKHSRLEGCTGDAKKENRKIEEGKKEGKG